MMLLKPPSDEPKSALQRQLDADHWRWSQQLQQQTDAAFEPAEIDTFRMTGLYGQVPGADAAPVALRPTS